MTIDKLTAFRLVKYLKTRCDTIRCRWAKYWGYATFFALPDLNAYTPFAKIDLAMQR